ncbi:dephospho-CoA kinase [Gorillibacterium sp. sgz500922]|uniref:dephospho-CoA kinase n=1 Tax=Gorillibacterium sp. sgz500922 TaxID=3446694 RepID=UPI003F674A9C
MNIGLTGGIACGKSAVAAMLAGRGAELIDADVIARSAAGPGSPGLASIIRHFGRDMLLPDGTLDRKRLGERIFAEPEERKVLDSILHPLVIGEIRKRMNEHAVRRPDKLLVADVPLLYEAGMEGMFEQVMVVYASPEVQLQRLMNRNGLTREEALQRIQAQMPVSEKAERADIVIRNDGSLKQTELQVEEFWRSKGLS